MPIDDILRNELFPDWAQRARRSILKNFQAGGRPTKWRPSNRVTERGGKTLVDKKILINSINVKATKTGLQASSSVVYAAIHNYGGTINKTVSVKSHSRKKKSGGTSTVKAHNRNMNLTMPKREFMLLQKSDFAYFQKTMIEKLSERMGNNE